MCMKDSRFMHLLKKNSVSCHTTTTRQKDCLEYIACLLASELGDGADNIVKVVDDEAVDDDDDDEWKDTEPVVIDIDSPVGTNIVSSNELVVPQPNKFTPGKADEQVDTSSITATNHSDVNVVVKGDSHELISQPTHRMPRSPNNRRKLPPPPSHRSDNIDPTASDEQAWI